MTAAADWVTAIATSLSSLGLIFLAFQVVFMRRQANADQERCRRENAVKFLQDWSRSLNRATSASRRFVESLDDGQVKALTERRSFEIEDAQPTRDELATTLTDAGLLATVRTENGKIVLPPQVVSAIRWQVILYLNQIETVFTAVRHGVADKEIVLEQFGFLIDPDKNRDACWRSLDSHSASIIILRSLNVWSTLEKPPESSREHLPLGYNHARGLVRVS